MTSTAKQYIQEIHKALHYHAVWLPGTALRPGVIGEVQDGVFVPLESLKENLGINVQVEPLTQNTENLLYQSQTGVIIRTKARGSASTLFKGVAEAEAGIAVRFSKQGASVLSLQNYSIQRLAKQLQLQREVLRRIDYHWKRSYVIVTEVVVAQTGTILVCEDSNAYIEISAKGGTTNPLADIGDASLSLKVTYTEGRIFSVVGAANLTPLFRGIRVTQGWLNTVSIGSYSDEDELDVDTMSDEQVEQMFGHFEL